MIKARQEMIFTKQDQIQFTLHGETRPFQSPPLLSSPPFLSPLGSGSETFPRASAHNPIPAASDYSSVVDSNDYDSLFDLDWLTSIIPEEENAPQMSGDSVISKKSLLEQTQQQAVVGDQSVCYEQFATATPDEPEPFMLSPPQFGHKAGCATPSHAGPSAPSPSVGLSTGQLPRHPSAGLSAGISAGLSAGLSAGQSAGLSAGLSAGQSAGHSAGLSTGLFTEPYVSAGLPSGYRPARLSTTVVQSSEYCPADITAGPSAGHAGGTSAAIWKKDPTQIVDPNVKYELRDVGKLGRALALNVYFGEAVLRESTPSGNIKRNLPLDQEKLRSLVTNIHHHSSFSNMNIRDFQQLVKKKILPSIAHLCKELRTRHDLKK